MGLTFLRKIHVIFMIMKTYHSTPPAIAASTPYIGDWCPDDARSCPRLLRADQDYELFSSGIRSPMFHPSTSTGPFLFPFGPRFALRRLRRSPTWMTFGSAADGTVLDVLLLFAPRQVHRNHDLLATRIADVAGLLVRSSVLVLMFHARDFTLYARGSSSFWAMWVAFPDWSLVKICLQIRVTMVFKETSDGLRSLGKRRGRAVHAQNRTRLVPSRGSPPLHHQPIRKE